MKRSLCLVIFSVVALRHTLLATKNSADFYSLRLRTRRGLDKYDRPETGPPCTTKTGVNCTSVPIHKCKLLNYFYSKGTKKTPAEKKLLHDAFCLIELKTYYVCCDEIVKDLPLRECGRSVLQKRILGGNLATLDAWPWMVGLYVYNSNENSSRFACGGSLIDREWVLTAAHCIPKNNPYETLDYVVLGELNLNSSIEDGANPMKVKLRKTIAHRNFTLQTLENDIALLQLEQPLENYTDHIRPICLQRPFDNEDYENPVVIGWGNTAYGKNNPPTHLQQVTLAMVSHSKCASSYTTKINNATQICASGPEGQDSCQGDSGGPLMFLDDSDRLTWFQAGIVSFGNGCGRADSPGVYTRVASYIDWINEKTGLTFW